MLQVVQAFVRQAMGYLDATPDKEIQVSLIKTLQTVTEGKVRPRAGQHQQLWQQTQLCRAPTHAAA
jgi:hypothetical protein